jgi:hypothetical protein
MRQLRLDESNWAWPRERLWRIARPSRSAALLIAFLTLTTGIVSPGVAVAGGEGSTLNAHHAAAPPGLGEDGACPRTKGESDCFINIHFDSPACASFAAPVSFPICFGTSTGGSNPGFVSDVTQARLGWVVQFGWIPTGTGPRKLGREVTYQGLKFGILTFIIQGYVNDPSSPDMRVDLAYTLEAPPFGAKFRSLPRQGCRTGQANCFTHINFVGGRLGADVYLIGVLYKVS